MTEHEQQEGGKKKGGGIFRTAWISVEYLSYHFAKGVGDNLRVMQRDANLFLGAAFTILGLLNWSSGKYCDGNTADYLSCTRPTAYYYFSAPMIALVLLGAMLILVWFVKNRRAK